MIGRKKSINWRKQSARFAYPNATFRCLSESRKASQLNKSKERKKITDGSQGSRGQSGFARIEREE